MQVPELVCGDEEFLLLHWQVLQSTQHHKLCTGLRSPEHLVGRMSQPNSGRIWSSACLNRRRSSRSTMLAPASMRFKAHEEGLSTGLVWRACCAAAAASWKGGAWVMSSLPSLHCVQTPPWPGRRARTRYGTRGGGDMSEEASSVAGVWWATS